MNPNLLRQYARDCERMAKERVDLFTREALVELALEFRRAAEDIESGSSSSRRNPPQKARAAPSRRVRGKIKRHAA